MGARRTSRLIASAVAVATFSSITAVPSAVAADDTTFVEAVSYTHLTLPTKRIV